jgi:integrase
MFDFIYPTRIWVPWNKGKLVGQKLPFTTQQVWEIRFNLEASKNARDLALFNLAIDSKLRGCDLVSLKVSDVADGAAIKTRGQVVQSKTSKPVQFEICDKARDSARSWIKAKDLSADDYLFKSRNRASSHISTRQYSRIVKSWARRIELDASKYGTHSLRRTKATAIYRKTKNLREVQLLLGHSKIDSTVRYLGIELEDALKTSSQIEM